MQSRNGLFFNGRRATSSSNFTGQIGSDKILLFPDDTDTDVVLGNTALNRGSLAQGNSMLSIKTAHPSLNSLLKDMIQFQTLTQAVNAVLATLTGLHASETATATTAITTALAAGQTATQAATAATNEIARVNALSAPQTAFSFNPIGTLVLPFVTSNGAVADALAQTNTNLLAGTQVVITPEFVIDRRTFATDNMPIAEAAFTSAMRSEGKSTWYEVTGGSSNTAATLAAHPYSSNYVFGHTTVDSATGGGMTFQYPVLTVDVASLPQDPTTWGSGAEVIGFGRGAGTYDSATGLHSGLLAVSSSASSQYIVFNRSAAIPRTHIITLKLGTNAYNFTASGRVHDNDAGNFYGNKGVLVTNFQNSSGFSVTSGLQRATWEAHGALEISTDDQYASRTAVTANTNWLVESPTFTRARTTTYNGLAGTIFVDLKVNSESLWIPIQYGFSAPSVVAAVWNPTEKAWRNQSSPVPDRFAAIVSTTQLAAAGHTVMQWRLTDTARAEWSTSRVNLRLTLS